MLPIGWKHKGAALCESREQAPLVPFFPSFFPSDHFNLIGVIVTVGEPERNCNEKIVQGFTGVRVIPTHRLS